MHYAAPRARQTLVSASLLLLAQIRPLLAKYVLGVVCVHFVRDTIHLLYLGRALIACPGGYGTFDELFEVLTLLQSGKISLGNTVPVVLFGSEFWRSVVDFDLLVERGVISPYDKERLFFTGKIACVVVALALHSCDTACC